MTAVFLILALVFSFLLGALTTTWGYSMLILELTEKASRR